VAPANAETAGAGSFGPSRPSRSGVGRSGLDGLVNRSARFLDGPRWIDRVFSVLNSLVNRACYDAETGGRFQPHRDNTTKGTAHRRFAVTINLNTEEYEGGELRFPEFGLRTYIAPIGGAVVFSCSLLHEATVVSSGKRFVYLPFLYDEAGAKVRATNVQFLDHQGQPTRSD
jgi:hypothetical protein